MKAWLGDESVEPISPLCGICGVDDPLSQGMELEADEEEKGDFILEGKDAVRVGKEDEDRRDEVRSLIDPRKPTKEEVELHDLFHLPYRNWCPLCVMAKGKELDHRKSIDEPRGLSEYSFDYAFPGDEFGFKLTVLSGR